MFSRSKRERVGNQNRQVERSGTAGTRGYSMASLNGLQLTATVTTDVDLNALTGGSVSVDVFYIVLP